MKTLFACTALLCAVTLCAQTPSAPKSPPATEFVTIGGKAITITYSSPRVNGRAGHIFTKDGLISHDPTYPVWRAGANAATTLHTETAINLGGLILPAGTYSLFIDISDPTNWVLIVNKQTGQWGTVYDKAQNLGRVPLTLAQSSATIEDLKFTLTDKGNKSGTLSLAWENWIAMAPLTLQ